MEVGWDAHLVWTRRNAVRRREQVQPDVRHGDIIPYWQARFVQQLRLPGIGNLDAIDLDANMLGGGEDLDSLYAVSIPINQGRICDDRRKTLYGSFGCA